MRACVCIVLARKDAPPLPTLSTLSLNRVKSILMVVGHIFKENMKYVDDYRMSLLKITATRQKKSAAVRTRERGEREERMSCFCLFVCLFPDLA